MVAAIIFLPASLGCQWLYFDTMARRPLKIGVRIVGERFPRFVIVNNRRRFWTGTDWAKGFRNALLYAHPWLVQQEVEELRQKHCG
jgi:hypothetical protein